MLEACLRGLVAGVCVCCSFLLGCKEVDDSALGNQEADKEAGPSTTDGEGDAPGYDSPLEAASSSVDGGLEGADDKSVSHESDSDIGAVAGDPPSATDAPAGNPAECRINAVDETEAVVSDAGVVDIVGEPQKTSVLFIFDKSGSMGEYWGGEIRWQAAAQMLEDAVSKAREVLGGELRVAAILFPLESGCEVLPLDDHQQIGFMPADRFLSTWRESASANGPEGSTPLAEAFQVADSALAEECRAGRLDHLFKIIVITDGEPNCAVSEGDAAGLLTELPAKWHDMGIKTFVFGLPGSDKAEVLLNDIARAGGTDEYFAPYEHVTTIDADGGVIDAGTVERTADDVSDDVFLVVV
jgi:Mg-chelatase subunit ChlD